MNKLLITLIVLVCAIYIKFYIRPNQSFHIIQLGIGQLKPSHLLEKSPIVIDDRIVDPLSVCTGSSAFRYLYITMKSDTESTPFEIVRNHYKYTILYALDQGVTLIHLYHPKNKSNTFVEIMLYTNQCIIVPMSWKYATMVKCRVVNLHDISSMVLSVF